MRFIIENVPPELHKQFGSRSLRHPNYPSDLHLDASKVTTKELRAVLKGLKRNTYIKLTPGKRAKRVVIHARQAVTAVALASAGAAALAYFF